MKHKVKKSIKRMKNRAFRVALVAGSAVAGFTGMARAEGMIDDMKSAATTAIATGATAVGAIMVAGFAIAVGIWGAKKIRSALKGS